MPRRGPREAIWDRLRSQSKCNLDWIAAGLFRMRFLTMLPEDQPAIRNLFLLGQLWIRRISVMDVESIRRRSRIDKIKYHLQNLRGLTSDCSGTNSVPF
jgi:hypothetical protein